MFKHEESKENNDINGDKIVEFFVKNKKKKPEIIEAWLKCGIVDNKGIWCFIYMDSSKNKMSCDGCVDWTQYNITNIKEYNDRLELYALVELLEWIYDENTTKHITLYSVNSYIVNCINEWIDKWKRNDFLISENNFRPNSDLLRQIDKYRNKINIVIGSYIENNYDTIDEFYSTTSKSF